MTLHSWIEPYLQGLERAGFSNSPQVCKWVLQHVTSVDIPDLSILPELNPQMKDRFDQMHARLVSGEPLQYVLGETEFYNCTICVGPGVLIPRPETEILVELALKLWAKGGAVLDLCTGSGCIPLAMAVERPEIPSLTGVDISEVALDWAERNRRRLEIDTVQFMKSDLYEEVRGKKFELITANPPYVSNDDYESLSDTVKCFEPETALFADDDGMAVIERIALSAPDYLLSDGWLICEIGCDQGDGVKRIFDEAGFAEVHVHKDYAGLDRIVSGQYQG